MRIKWPQTAHKLRKVSSAGRQCVPGTCIDNGAFPAILYIRAKKKRIDVPGVQPRHVAPAAPVKALLLHASVRSGLFSPKSRSNANCRQWRQKVWRTVASRLGSMKQEEAFCGLFSFFFITRHKVESMLEQSLFLARIVWISSSLCRRLSQYNLSKS